MNTSIFSAAFLAAALPVAAQAATVSVGSNGTAFTLIPGTSHSDTWEIADTLGPLSISDIVFTLIGTTAAAAGGIETVTISIDALQQEQEWTTFVYGGLVAIGYTSVPGFSTSDDFTVTLSYLGAPNGSVPLQATYAFTATPVIPVPAAGVLLVSALAGLGVVAKRRRDRSQA